MFIFDKVHVFLLATFSFCGSFESLEFVNILVNEDVDLLHFDLLGLRFVSKLVGMYELSYVLCNPTRTL